MKPSLTSIAVAAVAALAVSILPAQAASQFDGKWYVDAPQQGGAGGTERSSGCAPVRLPFTVKDNKISGSLARSTYGTGRVESSESAGSLPITGTVNTDGTLTAHWSSYTAHGKLSGDKAEIHWKGECGERTAVGGRDKG